MERYVIEGKHPLHGSARVQGSKNAVLPILAASILPRGICRIYDCPHITDVENAIEILKGLGCSVSFTNSTITVDSTNADKCIIDKDMMRRMRGSVIFLGALLSRNRNAEMFLPGGCAIGNRPIDIHLQSLRAMGVYIEEKGGEIKADGTQMHGCEIYFPFPSVGATENVILASVLTEGTTTVTNAAMEPEVCDLCDFLRSMGADISGDGTEHIKITGVSELCGTSHRVIPDRIVAATLMCGAMVTKSEIEISNVRKEHLSAVVSLLRQCGAIIEFVNNKMYIRAPMEIKPINAVRTQVYPGFPTDAQSLVCAMACFARGTSVIIENVFENRFGVVPELGKMNGNVVQDGKVAVIRGGELYGADLCAHDLRAGAALCIAALGASGESRIEKIEYIDRGYENLDGILRSLGAEIARE